MSGVVCNLSTHANYNMTNMCAEAVGFRPLCCAEAYSPSAQVKPLLTASWDKDSSVSVTVQMKNKLAFLIFCSA